MVSRRAKGGEHREETITSQHYPWSLFISTRQKASPKKARNLLLERKKAQIKYLLELFS